MDEKTKKILTGIFIFLLYIFISIFKMIPIKLFNLTNLSDNVLIFYSLIISFSLTSIIILILKKDLKKDYIDFKKNKNKYFNTYFKYWLISIALMAFSTLIIQNLTNQITPENEELIKELFKINPVFTFASAVLIAPILEELVFRKSLRLIFNNNLIFIIFSSIIFGAFHVLGGSSIMFIVPYSIPAIFFALAFLKSNNIFVPISLHFIHNGLLMSLQFLILILS